MKIFGVSLVIFPVLAAVIVHFLPIWQSFIVHTTGGVVISGASRGIGYAAAKALTREGYIVFAGVRNEKDLKRLAQEGDTNLVPVILDVTDQQTINAAFDIVKAGLKDRGNLPLVGVLNNAGVQHLRVLECLDAETLKWLFDVNVFGLISLTQQFLPLLRQQSGRIINVGSIAGFAAVPLYGAYSASKHAVEALSDTLRQELMEARVSVSLIQAGTIKTDMAGRYVNGVKKTDMDQTSIQADHSVECSRAYSEILDVADELLRIKADRTWPVEATSHAILHALTSPHPRPRYCVAGIDFMPCWFIKLLYTFLPERLVDKVISSGSTKSGTFRKVEEWLSSV